MIRAVSCRATTHFVIPLDLQRYILYLQPMNTLNAYIKSLPRRQRGSFRRNLAEAIGLSEPMVRHLANGTRAISAERAVQIEEATKGVVTRYELRPDLWPPPPGFQPKPPTAGSGEVIERAA
ncbi:transcriptional regulator [Methylomagnum ishizawai]|uniref:transcriptional regulator n=1 Tax=Methylomagnum ishizawai TaxID=1760988 RepID=UPI003CCEAEA2